MWINLLKLVVGLGNPGKQYDGTRHNVGFRVADLLAGRWQTDFGTEKFHSWFATAEYAGEKVVMLKPTTFMNRSGQAVLAAGRFYQLELADLLVVLDDVALELGRLRMRRRGSAGGHNGLRDIIERIGSDDVCRLRLGVGGARGNLVSHVLSRFDPEDAPVVDELIQSAADAVESWISRGPEATMNTINAAPDGGRGDKNDE